MLKDNELLKKFNIETDTSGRWVNVKDVLKLIKRLNEENKENKENNKLEKYNLK